MFSKYTRKMSTTWSQFHISSKDRFINTCSFKNSFFILGIELLKIIIIFIFHSFAQCFHAFHFQQMSLVYKYNIDVKGIYRINRNALKNRQAPMVYHKLYFGNTNETFLDIQLLHHWHYLFQVKTTRASDYNWARAKDINIFHSQPSLALNLTYY